MKKILFLLPLLISCKSVDYTYHDSMTFQEARSLHHKQIATSDGRLFEARQLFRAHQTHWPKTVEACDAVAREAEVEKFSMAMVINERGKVQDVLFNENGDKLTCYHENLVGKTYAQPPISPWYQIVNVTVGSGTGFRTY